MKILFVCMGNICRSPTAEGVLRHQLQALGWEGRVTVESAGTHNYHPGSPPDERTQHHARLRGYELSGLRARQVRPADFEAFDLIVAMDADNLARLKASCPAPLQHKLRPVAQYFRDTHHTEVPDPYCGGAAGFDLVLDLLEGAAQGLLAEIRARTSA